MTSEWPSGLDQFGEFLRTQGLSFDRRGSVPYTGDKIWQYSTSKIGVRVVAERGIAWSIQIADIAGWPEEWYPTSELRELLTGSTLYPDAVPFSDDKIGAQMKFVEEHWLKIVESFASENREQTHTALKLLRKQRNEHRWR
jgi:hypothetical protein